MYPSLEDVEFLARSESRVAVLVALGDGSRTHDELGNVVNASRVTLDRILNNLEDRGWIVRSDGRYESTPRGAFVASEFGRFLSTEMEGDETSVRSEYATQRTAADMSLEVIGFLARSMSRIEVLDAIRTEPRTRDELDEMTAASRDTLRRILAEFEERGWIEQTNHRCTPTSQGTYVVSEFLRLLQNLDAANELGGAVRWLPTDAFDLRCLDDATVLTPSWDDPTASIHRVADLVCDASRVRVVGPGVTREVVEGIRTLTTENGGSFEGVVDANTIDTVHDDPDLCEQLRMMLTSDRATLYRYDGGLPFIVVTIIDGTVAMCGHDEGDSPLMLVETDHDTVRSWAESYFESFRSDAERVDIEAFTA